MCTLSRPGTRVLCGFFCSEDAQNGRSFSQLFCSSGDRDALVFIPWEHRVFAGISKPVLLFPHTGGPVSPPQAAHFLGIGISPAVMLPLPLDSP